MVEEREPGGGMLTMGYSFSDPGAGATALKIEIVAYGYYQQQ